MAFFKKNKKHSERLDEMNSPKKGRKVKKVILGILLGILILGLAGGIAGSIFIYVQVLDAPEVNEIDLTPDGYLSVIEDVNGNKVNSLYMTESNRIQVQLKDTPETLQHAFVSIEDARFYDHHGIDIRGIIRAAVKGILKGGHFSEGASTITQQLLKNNVFDGWMRESSFMSRLSRKIQEQYLALQVEKKYNKDEILENYLNTINLGGGTRGVQVAARYYFGKDVSELDLAESALIAGITKNPTDYNPKNNPDKSLLRQELVLNAMVNNGYISEDEKYAALEEDVLSHLVEDSSQYTKVFSWFEDALLTSVVSDLKDQKGLTEEEAWNLIYSGGLTISSTMNSSLQELCESAVNEPAFMRDTEEVSVVVTDVETGAVAAIVGGRGEKTSSLIYNRATDSICQPGSTIKIIGEYAAAFDQGKTTLGDVIADEPYTYSNGTEIHNATEIYEGMTTVSKAIADSSNIVALKLFQDVGMDTTVEYLNRFGITTLDKNDHQEALAIGGTYNGVTNLELTAAYNSIADNGQYVRPYFYTKITDHSGNVILENKTEKTEAVSENAADLLTLGMKEVVTSGTGMAVNCANLEVAGKSGTSNEYRDSWFVGFSSRYTCGIWGGHDDHTPQADTSYVKEMWKYIMEQTPNLDPMYSSEPLVNESAFEKCMICTKCGKLAVTGLCDSTVQGSMVAEVAYIPGTQPTEICDCHEMITRCAGSGMRCGRYCPYSAKYSEVYLKYAIPGTVDEGFCLNLVSDEPCTVHQNLWDTFFKKKTDEEKKKEEEKKKQEEEKKKKEAENKKKKKNETQSTEEENSSEPEKTISDYIAEYFWEYFGEYVN